MSFGPTQNYDDPSLDRWRPRPVLAGLVRVLVVALPPGLAIAVGWLAATFVPASRLGINPWLWLAGEVALSTGLILALGRVTRRMLPLSALLTMALVFPDQAPSRLSVALRTHSTAALRERVSDVQARRASTGADAGHTTELLALVAALSVHDYATRGHSERVQGYAALLAQELHLPEVDAAKLRWAALLHDIGKLRVPAEILNKKGRPTDAEWEVLATHPHAGLDLVAPLADYLGDWVNAIAQHHERWDGTGYPERLAGSQIHLGARIIAVADTYDVITSTRSYKKAMPASQARAELARCAGSQFDPVMVRAFLAIGIGKLRLSAGPLSALSGLPGVRAVPDLANAATGASSVLATGAAASTAALGLLVGAVAGPATAAGEPAAPPAVAAEVAEPAPPRDAAAGNEWGAPGVRPSTGPADRPSPSTSPSPSTVPTPAATTSPAPGASEAPPATTPPVPPAAPPAARASVTCETVTRDEVHTCDLTGATLIGDWSGAVLAGADLSGATLSGVDLSEANLTGADLTGASITDSNAAEVKLTGATLTGARLVGVILREADLTGVRADGVIATDADLREARFAGASLVGADLSGSSLREADLSRTNLTEATLTGADLAGTSLAKATLVRTGLRDSIGTPQTTRDAVFSATVCPSGTVSDSACW